MTGTKAWRLSLAAILGFGWLFLTPAYSDDPLSLAAQEIQKLNSAVEKLDHKTDLVRLIDIAENKFTYAKDLADVRSDAIDDYDDAIDDKAFALQEKTSAQTAVDGQTATVELALTHKNNAQDALDIANINLQAAQANMQSSGGPGLQYTVYALLRNNGIAVPGSNICSGTWNSNYMQLPVCGNRYSDFIVKFAGQITVPSWFTHTKFAGYTDDGFKMYIDGQLAINNWIEQGATWSPYSPIYDVSVDKTLDVEIWWYNGGGPGSYHLGWGIPYDSSGSLGWTGAGCDYAGTPRVWGQNFSCNLNTFSSGSGPTQEQTNAYNNALAEKQAAQQVYNDKLYIYNQEVQTLQNLTANLTTATQNLTIAEQNLTNALAEKNNAISNFNNAINDLNNAIQDAWNYYDEQTKREIQRAIAQAAANAATNQPKPEPSPEPKPSPKPTVIIEPACDKTASATQCIPLKPTEEPKPEPTKPVDPKPEPTKPVEPKPEPTDKPKPEPTKPEEPKPTPAPTIEQKPEPTPEPPVAPSPEPKPLPRPDFKPAENVDPVIKDAELAALIPAKGSGTSEDLSGVIANLTSKDNKLIKLSVEQTAAVSQTLKSLTQEAKQEIASDLGISTAEIAKVAEAIKSDPAVAEAFVEFAERAGDAGEAPMPFTLADATTEVQTEAFLADPLGSVIEVDVKKLLSNFSELGSDMTDDQREKAQEVIVPVIIASQIAGAVIRRLN